MLPKRADWVTIDDGDRQVGFVIRVARDGSWVDVKWPYWSKRQRKPEVLRILTTISVGPGVTVTDVARERELREVEA